jgi:hypothetical protein
LALIDVPLLHHDDWLRLLPQTLKPVELTLFRRKEMDDHIAEVEQNPTCLR